MSARQAYGVYIQYILIANWQMAQGLGCFLELGPIDFLEILIPMS